MSLVTWKIESQVREAMMPLVQHLNHSGGPIRLGFNRPAEADWRLWDQDRAGFVKRLDRDKLIAAVKAGTAREFVETEIVIYLLTKEA